MPGAARVMPVVADVCVPRTLDAARRAGAGEEGYWVVAGQSFDDFYAVNFKRLAVQLYAYLGDLGEAQDVTQEAFCRAWQRWDRIGRYEDPVGWIRRVAWNIATSRWRRMKTVTSFTASQTVQHVDGPGPDRLALAQALAELPPKQRRAIVLHHLGGLTVKEIAEQCAVPENTVKSWLHRGRAALATALTGSN